MIRHVLTKVSPAVKAVPLLTVISLTKVARLQGSGVEVAVDVMVGVNVYVLV